MYSTTNEDTSAPTASLLSNSALGGSSAAVNGGAPADNKQRGTLEVELYGGPNAEDEDMLLDWELHAMRRWQMFGVDCTWLMKYLPERFHSPPEWCVYRLLALHERCVGCMCVGGGSIQRSILICFKHAAACAPTRTPMRTPKPTPPVKIAPVKKVVPPLQAAAPGDPLRLVLRHPSADRRRVYHPTRSGNRLGRRQINKAAILSGSGSGSSGTGRRVLEQ